MLSRAIELKYRGGSRPVSTASLNMPTRQPARSQIAAGGFNSSARLVDTIAADDQAVAGGADRRAGRGWSTRHPRSRTPSVPGHRPRLVGVILADPTAGINPDRDVTTAKLNVASADRRAGKATAVDIPWSVLQDTVKRLRTPRTMRIRSK